ncbi:hypothetical protein RND71_043570 [Anisodus tanguticus]|uniref:CNNM transmembrane domain-containing protein n=1 Tax=Anisodus tanguticus TaxID=243964 RepID=A0AAE1UR22_9SOLA|nr:hypothetical protein RND71_043570 [Anisodus tanguticus]
MVQTTLTVLLEDLTSGFIAVIGSTFSIVVFGEIVPQAICSRQGLAIGANTVFLMYFFMALTFPVSFPISWALDRILGFSRIPIYETDRSNIVAVLFAKDLAFVDPDDKVPMQTLCQYYKHEISYIFEDSTCHYAFTLFKEGKSHMAFVVRVSEEHDEKDPHYEVIGLVTLEDVLEEVLQTEIVDETDVLSFSVLVVKSGGSVVVNNSTCKGGFILGLSESDVKLSDVSNVLCVTVLIVLVSEGKEVTLFIFELGLDTVPVAP